MFVQLLLLFPIFGPILHTWEHFGGSCQGRQSTSFFLDFISIVSFLLVCALVPIFGSTCTRGSCHVRPLAVGFFEGFRFGNTIAMQSSRKLMYTKNKTQEKINLAQLVNMGTLW